jgi:hypothetical protein
MFTNNLIILPDLSKRKKTALALVLNLASQLEVRIKLYT